MSNRREQRKSSLQARRHCVVLHDLGWQFSASALCPTNKSALRANHANYLKSVLTLSSPKVP
jgi:hypothetical protein